VLLVATQCENRVPAFDLARLEAEFPDLLREDPYLWIDSKTGLHIRQLRKRIAATVIREELVPQVWPVRYDDAERRVAEEGQTFPHITRQRMHAILAEVGIAGADSDVVTGVFGRLGIITHFPSRPELRDFVVLNPHWLTKAISGAMESEQLKATQGEMSLDWLETLWRDDYPGLMPTFYACMRGFELCYPLDDAPRMALVPLRFPDAKPAIPWSDVAHAKERRIEYHFDGTPPAGLMSRFIVKTHHLIVKTDAMPKGVYWRKGVFLRSSAPRRTSQNSWTGFCRPSLSSIGTSNPPAITGAWFETVPGRSTTATTLSRSGTSRSTSRTDKSYSAPRAGIASIPYTSSTVSTVSATTNPSVA
jgi:hypothetical protein